MSLPLVSVGVAADLMAHEIDRLHGPVTLVRRATDLVEVLSVVRSGLARAVLVGEGAVDFAGEAVDSLLAGGAVVAVLEGYDDGRLTGLGAILVPAELPAREVAGILLEAAGRAEAGPSRARGTRDGAGPGRGQPVKAAGPAVDGAAGSGTESREPVDESPPPRPADGATALPEGSGFPESGVVVVWGPHGSPGRTTVAVNVAAELAALGHAVTLVDLDTWGPSVASLLGLLDESAGVALACRAADRHRLDPAALDRAAVRVDLGKAHLDVLTGLTRSERWPELRAASVRRLLRACRAVGELHRAGHNAQAGGGDADAGSPVETDDAVAETPPAVPDGPASPESTVSVIAGDTAQPIVVVDVGFSLEEEEELSFDTEAPRRNATTITALEEADLVLAVVSADVLGMPRAAKSLPVLFEHTTAPVLVVANKVRQAAAGRSPRAAIREAWEAIGAPAPISASVSFEPSTLDRAALDGSVLAEAAPSATVRAELRGLAQDVAAALSGSGLPDHDAEEVRGTSFGRRLSGWLRR